MAISSSSLTSSPTPIFSSTGISVISAKYYCNTDDTNSQYFSVWLVPNGDSPNNSNIIYNQVHVVAKDTYVCDREKIVLDNGDSIWANCTANITVTISSFSQ